MLMVSDNCFCQAGYKCPNCEQKDIRKEMRNAVKSEAEKHLENRENADDE